jgi:alkylation response protein AidB-like acyl-CoA dehydrogenase
MQTSTSVLAATGKLEPVIRDNLEATESERRIAAPVVDAIRTAGLQRLMLSTEDGGLEVHLLDALTVYEKLAGMDPSVGWIVWNNALPCLFSRFLDPATRARVLGNPESLHASSTRPSGEAVREPGGYRLTGRWALVSGCELAEWLILTGLAAADGGSDKPEMRYFFVRRTDAEVLDTWHVGGLKGTGSHDVSVQDLTVPFEFSLSAQDPSTMAGPYGHLPVIATLNLGMASQFIGIGQAAIDTARVMAETKFSPSPEPDMRDRPEVQLAITQHTTAIAAARTHLHAVAGSLWQQANERTPVDAEDLAAVYGAGWHATQAATAAVDVLYSLCGTAAIYRHCPLERLARDLRVMRQHVLTQPLWPTEAGRVLLGLPPSNPLYSV